MVLFQILFQTFSDRDLISFQIIWRKFRIECHWLWKRSPIRLRPSWNMLRRLFHSCLVRFFRSRQRLPQWKVMISIRILNMPITRSANPLMSETINFMASVAGLRTFFHRGPQCVSIHVARLASQARASKIAMGIWNRKLRKSAIAFGFFATASAIREIDCARESAIPGISGAKALSILTNALATSWMDLTTAGRAKAFSTVSTNFSTGPAIILIAPENTGVIFPSTLEAVFAIFVITGTNAAPILVRSAIALVLRLEN